MFELPLAEIIPGTLIYSLAKHIWTEFYILLTVHHVMILGKWPTWGTIFYVLIYLYFSSLRVSSTSCS